MKNEATTLVTNEGRFRHELNQLDVNELQQLCVDAWLWKSIKPLSKIKKDWNGQKRGGETDCQGSFPIFKVVETRFWAFPADVLKTKKNINI